MEKTRLSDQIALQLQEMIAEGSLKPGEKLFSWGENIATQ